MCSSDLYLKRYNKDFEISINEEDKKQYHDTTVSNEKLLTTIEYSLANNMEIEIDKIFDLLEMHDR